MYRLAGELAGEEHGRQGGRPLGVALRDGPGAEGGAALQAAQGLRQSQAGAGRGQEGK